MIVHMLFFGKLRELLTIDKCDVNLSQENTIQYLVDNMKTLYPVLNDHYFVCSLNKNYVYDMMTRLSNDDVVGFIPPISGG
jgi:molybdopterin converting factor small subunit